MTQYQKILKQYWGYDDFRGVQKEIIESIGSGKDTLGLMPTGGGKSITFQVPALSLEGTCIVITPLIALMKDQVMNLRKRGIQAAAIYSGLSHEEILRILENSVFGAVKLLYISPERLSSELFQTKLRHIKVSFITVDEAHCISQWGYDFRPSYLHIAEIRKMKPNAPILALTATATPEVVDDIQERLNFNEHRVFKMSFERKNLAYVVRHAEDKISEMEHILNAVKGCGIVYVRSRKRAKEIADTLNNDGFNTTFYHAGLSSIEKDERQTAWQRDEKRIIVATNAFGMGIDKPDVRIVIHTDCPSSIEAYFQEAGRAGRDGKKAYAVLLYNGNDQRKLQKRIADTFPDKDYIRQVYEHLAYFYQIAIGAGYQVQREFNLDNFCRLFKHFPIQVDAALKILQRAGYIEYTEEQENKARVKFLTTRNELYRLENNSPDEDKVIITILRNYGGLFTDYGFIDEALIAKEAGITPQQLYMILMDLSYKRIIHFIPQKRTPYIRYLQRREVMENVIIMPEVYEDRKKQFEYRIQAMINYAQNDKVCRSRQLLKYFGDYTAHDCGQCDVCLERKKKHNNTASKINEGANIITQLLADNKSHHITELLSLNLPTEIIDQAIELLVHEEKIKYDGSNIYLNQ